MSLDNTTYIQMTGSNLTSLIIRLKEKGDEQAKKYGNKREVLDRKIFLCELLKSYWFDFGDITTNRITTEYVFNIFGLKLFKKEISTAHVLPPTDSLHQLFIGQTIRKELNKERGDALFSDEEINFIVDEYINNFEEKDWLVFDSLNPHTVVNSSFEMAINKLTIELYEQLGEIEDVEYLAMESIIKTKEILEQSNSTVANVPQHIVEYWLSVAYPEKN